MYQKALEDANIAKGANVVPKGAKNTSEFLKVQMQNYQKVLKIPVSF